MKELILKKQNELEEIYKAVHMDVDGDAAREMLLNLIESGLSQIHYLSSLISNWNVFFYLCFLHVKKSYQFPAFSEARLFLAHNIWNNNHISLRVC